MNRGGCITTQLHRPYINNPAAHTACDVVLHKTCHERRHGLCCPVSNPNPAWNVLHTDARLPGSQPQEQHADNMVCSLGVRAHSTKHLAKPTERLMQTEAQQRVKPEQMCGAPRGHGNTATLRRPHSITVRVCVCVRETNTRRLCCLSPARCPKGLSAAVDIGVQQQGANSTTTNTTGQVCRRI